MNGFLLLIPFLLIRFGIPSILNKSSIQRAAHFPPMVRYEKLAYLVYQISNVVIVVYLCFLIVKIDFSWQFYLGLISYLLGLILCIISITNFAMPSNIGLNTDGVYKFSRNPMYLSYFVCFIGCAMLTQSPKFGAIVLIFQFSSHWIILSEERWCIERFGETYKKYMEKVRRYI